MRLGRLAAVKSRTAARHARPRPVVEARIERFMQAQKTANITGKRWSKIIQQVDFCFQRVPDILPSHRASVRRRNVTFAAF